MENIATGTVVEERAGEQQARTFAADVPGLLRRHFEQLHLGSGIAIEVIQERVYLSVQSEGELADRGFSSAQRRVPGLLIPVYSPGGENRLCQYRPDTPRIVRGRPVKYETPLGTGLTLDVPPRCLKDIDDPTVTLWITEGV